MNLSPRALPIVAIGLVVLEATVAAAAFVHARRNSAENAATGDTLAIALDPSSPALRSVALFFRDLGHGAVKISFRSTGDADSNALARRFGGGGHAKASGAVVWGSLEEVREKVIEAAREILTQDAVDSLRS